ncbi:FecR domain-containing protein [Herbaspirillum sp. YR522]|uniref:FecR domain-containing protein n=1 Tax=Herbaspirillum sp. YR522 TaxID=1144342 RepID=UPI00026FBC91|nr:FecR domain-containing protein [Herbaspirillum sp. YR522]EJM97771.1 Fe2+-dicitrate sensor, membrane component [Herbaspirillum sp. YR522]
MHDRLHLSRPAELPMAAEAPTFEQLQQAAEWFAILRADDADATQQQRWHQWLERDARHHAAWKRVEAVNAEFGLLPASVDHRVLSRDGRRRRRVVKTLAWLATGAGVAGSLGSTPPVRDYVAGLDAQFRTARGQTSQQQLADGSTLWLNTASAADAAFDDQLRRIALYRGEIMVQTAHDAHQPARALVVDTRAGRMQALGTRFLVRLEGQQVGLTVLQGRVRITPAGAGLAASRVIQSGQRVRFDRDGIGAAGAADDSHAAWTRQLLMPDGMRLDEFLAELARYRPGYLGCAPEVAGLRLVGVYPIGDTDRVLRALEATLPVRVRRISPWWVTVQPAAPS